MVRDLTEQELALAPEWATHYFIYSDGDILFESGVNCQLYKSKSKEFCNKRRIIDISEEANPIPRKPFDITQHEWEDESVRLSVEGVYISIQSNDDECLLAKSDAIAVAKHFKLTAEDLK